MSLLSGFRPETGGTLSGAESGHRPFRQVSWLAGVFPGLALPIDNPTVDSGLKPRLQWRYHGGLSPPSLFSLGGHLNGQWLYI